MKPNPFKKKGVSDLSAEEALSTVTGHSADADLMKRMTEAMRTKTEMDSIDVPDEFANALEIKKGLEELRAVYLDWALNHDLGARNPEIWIEMFEFTPEGVIARGNLNLNNRPGITLPPKLIRVEGTLSLVRTDIQSLKDLPKEITGNLDLRNIPAKEIPQDLSIGRSVFTTGDQEELIASAKKAGYSAGTI